MFFILASADDLTALLPVTWNLCERSLSLAGALSVHSGRKREKAGGVVSSWLLRETKAPGQSEFERGARESCGTYEVRRSWR